MDHLTHRAIQTVVAESARDALKVYADEVGFRVRYRIKMIRKRPVLVTRNGCRYTAVLFDNKPPEIVFELPEE